MGAFFWLKKLSLEFMFILQLPSAMKGFFVDPGFKFFKVENGVALKKQLIVFWRL